ncbi:uncharacterized protein LOC132404523 isoform X2 [Hypanus sabinus]|uniref:uncharacterized protein LOC132404523 isoform X2 n=1 Tax=Hypanus sabinus TaxID=79690 RepID=UPI0028C3C4FB|nr:uncharacterized protein LOC132404523 isoform X2 [Hypanus sabinus]
MGRTTLSFNFSSQELSSYSLILGGDFNCWLDPVLDRSSSIPRQLRTPECVNSLDAEKVFDQILLSRHTYKQPRLNEAHLQKPEREGGLALPNFRSYYWAANIRNIIFYSYFYNQSVCPTRVAMELNAYKKLFIPALLGFVLPCQLPKSVIIPVIRHPLRIWAQFRKYHGLYSFSLSSPILYNHLFQPSMQDSTFQGWCRRGIRHFEDLFIDNRFASFEQLSIKFNLPNTHFFRYLQIRHFISPLIPHFPDVVNYIYLSGRAPPADYSCCSAHCSCGSSHRPWYKGDWSLSPASQSPGCSVVLSCCLFFLPANKSLYLASHLGELLTVHHLNNLIKML